MCKLYLQQQDARPECADLNGQNKLWWPQIQFTNQLSLFIGDQDLPAAAEPNDMQ